MLLNQEKAMGLLEKYKIRHVKTVILKSERDLQKLRYPVVLKVDSRVIHKSDTGLVATGLESKEEVRTAMNGMKKQLRRMKVKKHNFIVQDMEKGVEVIMGVKQDDTFGPVIMFGIGGVMVEVMKDVSMRIAPLTVKDCKEMIEEIKGKKLLEGYRNMPKADREELAAILMKLSKLATRENVSEIDLNPVMVKGKRAVVVDARIINA